MLLHWDHLRPEQNRGLAAVRFSSPVRISNISIFSQGAVPFVQAPDIVAKTEPKAFFLDVYLNALTSGVLAKEKQTRPANSLVKSTIAYAGSSSDFKVDMGNEYSTRLLIFKGEFKCITMAIYGSLAADTPRTDDAPEHAQIVLPEPQALPRAVDPANSLDPTKLAKQLLQLLPDSPPLPLALRLMFCLKATDDDWDLPNFPFVYSLPDMAEVSEMNEDDALDYTSHPIPDDVSVEALETFAARIADCFGPKVSVYDICCLLSNLAPQPPAATQAVMRHIKLDWILDNSDDWDSRAVSRLIEAATNPDIARQLSSTVFLGFFRGLQMDPKIEETTRMLVEQLITRIEEWALFEDALCNTQGDFVSAVHLMQSVGRDEACFGIWLASMTTNNDILSRLEENPILPPPEQHPPVLFDTTSPISHDEFISFVRAFIGVASTLVVLAWSDSIGNDKCRERTLALLRLWQSVDGYREIVNHLLLLRQLTFRLEWVTSDNDPPRRSGILAEQIFADLTLDLHHISLPTNTPLVQSIISLKQPLSHISEEERLLMRKLALVVEDGLPAALEELTFLSDRPLSLRRLRTLRVSLAIMEEDIRTKKDGGWNALQNLWEGTEKHCGLVSLLMDLFVSISEDTKGHFPLNPAQPRNHTVLRQLFLMANDLLRVIGYIIVDYPPVTRLLSTFTNAIADIFVFTDSAAMLCSQSTPVAVASQITRQRCVEAIRQLSEPGFHADHGKLGAEIAFRSLLRHGLDRNGCDPSYRVLQVFCLIDLALPLCYEGAEDDRQVQVRNILPNLLPDIEGFFRVLDPENKVHFLRRLYEIDGDILEVGQWMLVQELKHLNQVLVSLSNGHMDSNLCIINQHRAFLSFCFLADLIAPDSSSSSWCINAIVATSEASALLGDAILALLAMHLTSPRVVEIAQAFVDDNTRLDPQLNFAIVLVLLHNSQNIKIPLSKVIPLLHRLPLDAIDKSKLRTEVGRILSAFSESSSLTADVAIGLFNIFDWLHDSKDISFRSLVGVTSLGGELLFLNISCNLSSEDADKLAKLQQEFIFDEDALHPLSSDALLPQSIRMSIQDINNILHPIQLSMDVPSTPKTHTPDIMTLVTTSPTSLFNSPVASTTGLTKTYLNNDFRQLRQQPASAGTSTGGRHPSLHVDDFLVNPSSSPPRKSMVTSPSLVEDQQSYPAYGLVNVHPYGDTLS